MIVLIAHLSQQLVQPVVAAQNGDVQQKHVHILSHQHNEPEYQLCDLHVHRSSSHTHLVSAADQGKRVFADNDHLERHIQEDLIKYWLPGWQKEKSGRRDSSGSCHEDIDSGKSQSHHKHDGYHRHNCAQDDHKAGEYSHHHTTSSLPSDSDHTHMEGIPNAVDYDTYTKHPDFLDYLTELDKKNGDLSVSHPDHPAHHHQISSEHRKARGDHGGNVNKPCSHSHTVNHSHGDCATHPHSWKHTTTTALHSQNRFFYSRYIPPAAAVHLHNDIHHQTRWTGNHADYDYENYISTPPSSYLNPYLHKVHYLVYDGDFHECEPLSGSPGGTPTGDRVNFTITRIGPRDIPEPKHPTDGTQPAQTTVRFYISLESPATEPTVARWRPYNGNTATLGEDYDLLGQIIGHTHFARGEEEKTFTVTVFSDTKTGNAERRQDTIFFQLINTDWTWNSVDDTQNIIIIDTPPWPHAQGNNQQSLHQRLYLT